MKVRVHRGGEGRLSSPGLCRTLQVSRAGFYAWPRAAARGARAGRCRLGVEIAAIHAESRHALRQSPDSRRAEAAAAG